MKPQRPRATPIHAAVATTLMLAAGGALAQTPTEAELSRRLDLLATELGRVKAQLAELQQQKATPPTPPPVAVAPPPAAPPSAEAATVLSSYGEINYNRPLNARQDAQADIRRFVLGFQHRFDPRTKVVTELEVEHAVSSADDAGEVEVEQAFIERQLNPTWALRGGLFLMPAGLLNENHEPTAFYGVERNFVETRIIPSTWREGGVQFVGNFDSGLTLQTGISTGFDLGKWDAASSEGAESPLGSIHQEMSLARAYDLAVFGALNWRGIPGLQLGGSLFSGGATHGQTPTSARVTLWDLHARWTPGRWDLAALYSRGSISGSAALNAPLVGGSTLIPQSFDGGYLLAAYRLWSNDEQKFSPFVRIERVNTGRSYADLGPGLTPAARPTEQIATLGANYEFAQGVVFKADLQRFRDNRDADRFSLGLGWSF